MSFGITEMVTMEQEQIAVEELDRDMSVSSEPVQNFSASPQLLQGAAVPIDAKGMAHTSAVLLTQRLFTKRIGWTVFVKAQDPIRLADEAVSNPDISIVSLNTGAYSTRHPDPADVYMVMEIADAAVEHDLEVKAEMYAAAGISDYWVLDVTERKLHVLRQPVSDAPPEEDLALDDSDEADEPVSFEPSYQSRMVLDESALISPLAFAKIEVRVADMLPPAFALG